MTAEDARTEHQLADWIVCPNCGSEDAAPFIRGYGADMGDRLHTITVGCPDCQTITTDVDTEGLNE